jgi:peptide/nickel transport system substrate-binding protein
MSKDFKALTRREFMELAVVGAAGAATLSLGAPEAFAAKPKRGGTVTCGMQWMIQTPDPHRYSGTWGRQAFAMAWEGLTTPTSIADRIRISKEKGPDAVPDVQPMLAEAWEIEKGGTRYVIHLKKGVKFHNGKELDSEDVKWNWERVRDPVHIALSRKLLTQFLKSIETPDRYTIVGNMTQPYGGFLVGNAWVNTPIMPKDSIPHGVIWGVTPTFKPPTAGPPGTGPFKLVKFQQKFEAQYERFDEYHAAGLPYLDKIIYKVISKDVPRTMALRAGDVDYIFAPEPNWLSKVMKGKEIGTLVGVEKEGLYVFPRLGENTHTIYLNCHSEKKHGIPFRDVRVRQAFDYCLDREKIAKTLYGDLAVPMGQGYHPAVSSWGYPDIKPRKRDIEKAKQLLKEAGYPNGLDVEFRITPTWGKQDLMAQIVQQMAKPAGFRLKISPSVGVQYWNALRAYTFQMQVYTIAKEDPMQFYYGYLHTDPVKPYSGFAPVSGAKDPIMDELLDDVAAETDFKKRKAKFKKVVLRSNEQAYLIPYMLPVVAVAWSKKLNNFKPWNYYYPEQAFREAWLEA